jgi:hypothetical protein
MAGHLQPKKCVEGCTPKEIEMKRSTLQVVLFGVALLLTSSSAWADSYFANGLTGTIWNVPGNELGAQDPALIPGAIKIGTFTSNVIDFQATGSQTLGDFLSSATVSITPGDSSYFSALMSNPGSCPSCSSTFLVINGNTTFLGGTTYTLTHDDGAVMYAGGNLVINSPAPTTPLPSGWTPGADVTGAFTIYYEGTNGNPEVLKLEGDVRNVPDGGMTLMLLGGALVGLATLRRKFRA